MKDFQDPGQALCVHCVYALMVPATRVDAERTHDGQDAPPDFRHIGAGPGLVVAVRRARDDGYRITINNEMWAGVYADMIFHGDTVCSAHLWLSIEQARNPKSRTYAW